MEWIRTFLLLIFLFPALANGMTRHYKFNIVMRKMTRLCSSKPIVTVNGQYPGPTLSAREGDNIIVKVVNHVQYNVTIHWHGVKQIRTGWADGPAYITQCPIPPGQSYVYNFTLVGQRGTLWYHAHILWLRDTVHGALIIKPKLGVPYPFPKPHEEAVVILGEWWKADTEAVINQAMRTGTAPNVSDAHLINGYPGPIAGCPSQGGYELKVRSGKTYMLRIINAALNDDLFLKIAGHELRVVEADAVYTKPFYIDTAVITPGQTTNVLLTADKPAGRYLITASPYMDAMTIAIDNRTATATLIYEMDPSLSIASALRTARVPQRNDTAVAAIFSGSLRSLNSKNFPANVPRKIDHSLLFTIGLGINRCRGCINGSRVVAAMNNVSFVMPETALLEAHFFNKRGVFTTDFPGRPPVSFDYTGSGPKNMQTTNGTRLYRLPYNSTVEIVLQDTGIIAQESHPIHLHGFNFFVVGQGIGNYDPQSSPSRFNLIDPIERNTVGVPSGGWAAIRFRADNPGVWFMHCHFEVHTSWGLKMAFLVENGKGAGESLLPPPRDLPKC